MENAYEEAMNAILGPASRGHVSSPVRKTNGASLAETPPMRIRWRFNQADTQTSLWAPTQIRPCWVNTAFKDGQLVSFFHYRFEIPLAKQASTTSAAASLPWSSRPASSRSSAFLRRSSLLVAIFTVGTKPPSAPTGLETALWQPAPANAPRRCPARLNSDRDLQALAGTEHPPLAGARSRTAQRLISG